MKKIKQDKIQLIIKLYKDDTPINRIASITGVTRPAIKNILALQGLYNFPVKPAQQENISDGAISPVPADTLHTYNNNINNINNIKDININEIKDIKDKEININEIKSKDIKSKDIQDSYNIIYLNKIINKLLKRINNNYDIKDLNINTASTVVNKLIDSKVKLNNNINPGKDSNNFIIQFISNRNFIKEIETIKDINNIPINVKAIEE